MTFSMVRVSVKMNRSILNIYKIEMEKLIKRKDWISLVALIAIGMMFGVAVMSDGYVGMSNQSGLFWVCTQVFNSSILFITPMVFSFISANILANEIESKSILMYTNRFGNRKNMYIGKSVALISFATLTFIIICISNLIIYYVFVSNNPSIASGILIGENSIYLIIVTLMLYLASFILASQFSLFLSTIFKPTKVIGIVFLSTLILHNIYKVPVIRNLNPWYYIVRFSSDVISTTDNVVVNLNEKCELGILFLIVCFIYIIIFNILGVKKFKKLDL